MVQWKQLVLTLTVHLKKKNPKKTNQQNKNPKKQKGIIISTGNKMTAGNQIL